MCIESIDLESKPCPTFKLVRVFESFGENVGDFAEGEKVFDVELDRFTTGFGELFGIVFAFLTCATGVCFALCFVLCGGGGRCGCGCGCGGLFG